MNDRPNKPGGPPDESSASASGPNSSSRQGDESLQGNEAERWIAALIDGNLSTDEANRLAEKIAADADLRAIYQQQVAMHAMLQWHHGTVGQLDHGRINPVSIAELLVEAGQAARRQAAEEAAEEAAEQLRKIEQFELSQRRRVEPVVISRSFVYWSAATIAGLAFWVASTMFSPSDVEIAKNEQPVTIPQDDQIAEATLVAEISDSIDALIISIASDEKTGIETEKPISIAEGTRLATGRYRLTRGVVEVDFDSGASIVLEAPATIELDSTDGMRLFGGRLVGLAPPEAIGFTVETPTATVIDLGTRFGVAVFDNQATDVSVFDGEVALAPDGDGNRGMREILSIGTARRVSADGISVSDIEFNQASFLHEVPTSLYELAVLKSRPLAFWRMNETIDSPQVASLGRLNAPGIVGQGVTLGQTTDRPGSGNLAATFAGQHDGINVGYLADLALTSDFTIEAWVQTTPPDGLSRARRFFSSRNGSPIAGYAFGVADGQYVQRQKSSSMFLFFTFFGVYDCVAEVGLQPNRWTHVAAVISAKGRPALFMDGQEVSVRFRTMKSGGRFLPLLEAWNSKKRGIASSSPRYLGRNPLTAGAKFSSEAWQGGIDELAIFNRMLSKEEVLDHFKAGVVRASFQR